MDRIDGSDVTAVHPRVHEGIGTGGGIVEVLVGTVQVEAELQVGSGTYVHAGTAGQTVEGGSLHVTVLIQVAHGHVVVALVGGTAGAHIVLLAETGLDGLGEPVQVVPVTGLDGGVGNQLSVLEQGVVGHVVDVQVETF